MTPSSRRAEDRFRYFDDKVNNTVRDGSPP
jgi:hypothetical protein